MPPRLERVIRPAFLGAVFLLASCGDRRQTGAPPALSTNSSAGVASASSAPADDASSAAASNAPPPGEPPYRTALRLERWREAADLIDAMDPAAKGTPEMRFVRARVANALGEQDKVRPLLDGVDIPLFADDILRLRAEAAVEVGPYAEAATYYKDKGRPRDLVMAARALSKGGDDKGALALADKALEQAQRLGRANDERAAHGLRVELLKDKVDLALGDLKWLAIHAPASPEGQHARDVLATAKKTLTDKELADSIDALVGAGAGKDALDMLDRFGKSLPKATADLLRAQALFKSRQYTKAADAFIACSKGPSSGNGEELYYAGKALARVKKEDQAIQRFNEVVKRYRTGPWADRAAFQIGELHMLAGRFDDAEKAFTSYLASFPRGASKDDAEYALALAYMSNAKPAKARQTFERLADNAKRTDVGTLRELAGVAALRAHDENGAVALFTKVAREQPLTWGATVARARLKQLRVPLPPVIDPPEVRARQPLAVLLPAKAEKLFALGLDADAEAAIAENEQGAGAAYPGREAEALCAMYGKLSRAKRRYKVGNAAVSFDDLMRAPSDADRWEWECIYPMPYSSAVFDYEKQYELVPGLVHAIMRQESAFDPDATSPVGATGLMQLMPNTANEAAKEANVPFVASDLRTPDANVRLGSFYLGKLAHTYAGSLPLAIASYNAGPGAVSRWVETCAEPEIDLWVARIPYEETRNYVARVMSNLVRYEWMRGGDAAVIDLPLTLPPGIHSSDDDY